MTAKHRPADKTGRQAIMKIISPGILLVLVLSVTGCQPAAETANSRGQLDDEADWKPPLGRGQIRPDDAPRVGDLAPLFQLKSLDGKTETRLEAFRGKRPVVLIFGSYT